MVGDHSNDVAAPAGGAGVKSVFVTCYGRLSAMAGEAADAIAHDLKGS